MVQSWVTPPPKRLAFDAYAVFWRPRSTLELCSWVFALDLKLWVVMAVFGSGEKKVTPQQASSTTCGEWTVGGEIPTEDVLSIAASRPFSTLVVRGYRAGDKCGCLPLWMAIKGRRRTRYGSMPLR